MAGRWVPCHHDSRSRVGAIAAIYSHFVERTTVTFEDGRGRRLDWWPRTPALLEGAVRGSLFAAFAAALAETAIEQNRIMRDQG